MPIVQGGGDFSPPPWLQYQAKHLHRSINCSHSTICHGCCSLAHLLDANIASSIYARNGGLHFSFTGIYPLSNLSSVYNSVLGSAPAYTKMPQPSSSITLTVPFFSLRSSNFSTWFFRTLCLVWRRDRPWCYLSDELYLRIQEHIPMYPQNEWL